MQVYTYYANVDQRAKFVLIHAEGSTYDPASQEVHGERTELI
jgi:hypothetical protein